MPQQNWIFSLQDYFADIEIIYEISLHYPIDLS